MSASMTKGRRRDRRISEWVDLFVAYESHGGKNTFDSVKRFLESNIATSRGFSSREMRSFYSKQELWKNGQLTGRGVKRRTGPKYPAVQQRAAEFIRDYRQQTGTNPAYSRVQEQALQAAEELGKKEFKASKGWIRKRLKEEEIARESYAIAHDPGNHNSTAIKQGCGQPEEGRARREGGTAHPLRNTGTDLRSSEPSHESDEKLIAEWCTQVIPQHLIEDCKKTPQERSIPGFKDVSLDREGNGATSNSNSAKNFLESAVALFRMSGPLDINSFRSVYEAWMDGKSECEGSKEGICSVEALEAKHAAALSLFGRQNTSPVYDAPFSPSDGTALQSALVESAALVLATMKTVHDARTTHTLESGSIKGKQQQEVICEGKACANGEGSTHSDDCSENRSPCSAKIDSFTHKPLLSDWMKHLISLACKEKIRMESKKVESSRTFGDDSCRQRIVASYPGTVARASMPTTTREQKGTSSLGRHAGHHCAFAAKAQSPKGESSNVRRPRYCSLPQKLVRRTLESRENDVLVASTKTGWSPQTKPRLKSSSDIGREGVLGSNTQSFPRKKRRMGEHFDASNNARLPVQASVAGTKSFESSVDNRRSQNVPQSFLPRSTTKNSYRVSPMDYYESQNERDKPKVLLCLSYPLERCNFDKESWLDRPEWKPLKKHLLAETRRRHCWQRMKLVPKPNTEWNVQQLKGWLTENPIHDPQDLDRIRQLMARLKMSV